MSTLFALEGVNFFDAFTFEVFGRWDGCRFFLFPRRQHIGNSKKKLLDILEGWDFTAFLANRFFLDTVFLEGWDFEVSVKNGWGGG